MDHLALVPVARHPPGVLLHCVAAVPLGLEREPDLDELLHQPQVVAEHGLLHGASSDGRVPAVREPLDQPHRGVAVHRAGAVVLVLIVVVLVLREFPDALGV
ncbi:MAG: hypothetical protein CL844_05545 [Crocinitomicaceae bacterium]|nr:hypothetical protein [Crocinitomicaceae bacterium]